jgi:OmpR family two-component system sensor histidine kinase YxdK
MKKIIRNFFIDRLLYVLFMLVSSVLIIIFYTLTVGRHVEIIYPLIITVFLIISMLAIDCLRYYSFNRDIEKVQEDKNHKIKTFTREQKEVAEAIKYINLKHAEKEQDILTDYENKIYFLSAAIHKFKNYIAVMDLIIERNKYKNKDLEVVLRGIEYENDNLCSSLEQVLNYIRLNNFGNDFEPVAINLYDELKDIINSNRNAFINNDIFPVLSCNENDSAIVTDKKWNRAIIEQIITNAIKYSSLKDESKKIYFNIKRKDKNTFLIIKDEGIGIPKYDLKKIFEPFFTGENGRKIRNSTGIGLYIIKEIALKLGHEIYINSEVDMGTEVTIKYLSKL